MFIKIKPVIKSLVPVIVSVFAAGATVFAWTEPGSSPPSGNVAGPINTSGGTQTKAGDLVLPNLYLNAIGSEGNIYNANIVQGYNDLFLRSNSAENATLYLSGSQLDFWSGTPSQPRWSINSAGTLTIGSVPWARLISLPSACPAGQYVSAVGSSLACSAPASSGIGGSGTANYVPKFTAGTTLGNSIIYDDGIGVGIGTTVPDSELSITGDIITGITLKNSGNYTGRLLVSGDTVYVGSTHSSVGLALQAGGDNRVYINASGNVGIGTTAPDSELSITGDIITGITLKNSGNYTGRLLVSGDTVYIGSTHSSVGLALQAGGGNIVYINTSGNVGIGTVSPNAKLAVGGAGSAGDAIAAYANSANSALYAEQAGTGYAGYFSGKVRFSSDIIVANMGNCPILKTDATGLLSCNFSSYLTSEADPQVGTITTSGKWCTTDGSQINCSTDTPSASQWLNSDSDIYYNAGSVGIGDISPASLLTVGSGDLFQVNSSGNLVKINNVPYSWPASQGTASTYLKNDGSGSLSWAVAAGGGVNSYAYSSNAALDIIPPNFDWQDITSRTLSNVPANTLLVIDASASIQMLYNNWPDGVSTVLNGRMRITVNGTEQKICYVNSPATSGWDYGNCSINTVFLTPAAGNYTVRLQGRKINADHQASFFYTDLRAVGLPYTP